MTVAPAAARRAGRGPVLPAVLIVVVMLAAAAWLWLDGRWLICECGRVGLWAGKGNPDGSSQHLTDWYTPSHLIHGFLFFWLAWLILPRWPVAWRLLAATVVEVAWEIIENSEWIIDRYRQVTVSRDYNGDTVVNSLADVLAMLAGFALAGRLPVWLSVATVLGLELLTGWIIRDGLALNVLMLLWPVPAIRDWQAGA